jgi:phospholipid/cholesterol/gamma-HCH transport system substrate-binding protein
MRRHQPRISNFKAGLIGAALILAVCYLVFGGSLPFGSSPFVLRATFTAQTELHLGSPVRIAGVNVGTVTGISRVQGSPTAAVVTMTIQPSGLPIHGDATATIRPRLFLEGNYYVDLHPGTPAAPTVSSGGLLPAANTSGPVQLDRVLSALTSGARQNLQTLLQGFGGALNGRPTAAEDATADPSQRGLTAGQSLNRSLRYAPQAFEASSIVNQALLGTAPHDLSGAIVGQSHLFGALAADHQRLADFVTVFNSTMGALASRQQALSQTIGLLPAALRATNDAIGPLEASFGPTRAFAAALTPSIKQLPATITAGLPWIAQSTALLSPSELGGLLHSLTPAVQNTASSLKSTEALLTGSKALAKCFIHNLIPTGNEVISDPPNTTGLQLYQELFQSAVGLASIGQSFDGNGRYLRAIAGGGSDRIMTGSLGTAGPLYGNAVLAPLGTRPAYPGSAPPVRSDVACFKNAPPNLNDVTTGAG